jgi:hypothetical protein
VVAEIFLVSGHKKEVCRFSLKAVSIENVHSFRNVVAVVSLEDTAYCICIIPVIFTLPFFVYFISFVAYFKCWLLGMLYAYISTLINSLRYYLNYLSVAEFC